MELGPLILWIGNGVSFGAGVLLAVETVLRERELRKILKVAKMFKSPELTKLKYEVNGIVISDDRDLQLAHLRLSSKRARLGLVFLVIGFLLIVAGELLRSSNHI